MERLICLAIGYVCGLFQTSYIIGRMHKTDIREHGSGNAGVPPTPLGLLAERRELWTLLGDCLKCIIAMVIVRLLFRNSYGDILLC